MNATLQLVIVVPIVATALGYATLKLMPKAARARVALGAGALARRAGWSSANVRRVEAKLATSGACGSCDSCKACATQAPQTLRDIPVRTVA